jgi:hypothetical protein
MLQVAPDARPAMHLLMKYPKRYQCNRSSYHRAPSIQLTRDIDSHVASQVLIFIFTLEIGFTGVDVSFISIVAVVLHFIIGHGITSFVGCYVAGCNPLCLI